jgi:6-pyruvoyl-tetrahydropterin synthase
MISDRPELVDKACAVPHTHTSKIRVTVPIFDHEFLDFKTVKKGVENVIGKMRDKNITAEFGLGQTEEFVEYVANEVKKELKREKINVYIQETEKYGMEYVSD